MDRIIQVEILLDLISVLLAKNVALSHEGAVREYVFATRDLLRSV